MKLGGKTARVTQGSPVPETLMQFPTSARSCPFSPPDELLSALAEGTPQRVRLWDGSTPWLLTSQEYVRAALRDDRLSKSPVHPGLPSVSRADAATTTGDMPLLSRMDDPRHAALRVVIQESFKPASVRSYDAIIRSSVKQALATLLAGNGQGEIVNDFALPIPSRVICEILGVPYEDHGDFQKLSAQIARKRHDVETAHVNDAHRELTQYMRELVDRRSAEPDGRLVSAILRDYEDPGLISRDETVGLAKLLLIAGHETVSNSIALSTAFLLCNRPALDRILKGGIPWPSAVDELLRFITVIQRGEERVATEDVTLLDLELTKGDGLICLLATANRDPETFPEPEIFEPARDNRKLLSFGLGIHQCVGQFLGRLEMTIALETLFERLPTLRLDMPEDELEFIDGHAYGLAELRVAWDED